MRSKQSVEAAEAKMLAAKEALLGYVEGRDALDRDDYRRLVARVKKAEAEFLEEVEDRDE